MILQRLLRLKLIQLIKNSLVFLLFIFLSSCFIGPVKELKNQIDDSYEDDSIPKNPNPLNEFSLLFEPEIIWKKNIENQDHANLSLYQFNNNLYAASPNGNIKCLSEKNGEIVWDFEAGRSIIAGLSGDGEDKIFYITEDGYLNSINLKANIEWKTFVGQTFSVPKYFDSFIIVKNSNNKFFKINSIDGSIIWTYQAPQPPLTYRSWGGITIYDNTIFSGLPGGRLIALNFENGTLVWDVAYSFATGYTEIDRANDTTSMPQFDDNSIYVISSKGNLAKLSLLDGSIIWERKLSSFHGLIVKNKFIYVTHNSGSIYKLNKISNEVIWRNADLQNRAIGKGIIFDEYLIVGDYDGYLHYISTNDGVIKSRIKVSDSIILDNFNIKDEYLFVISKSGDVLKIKNNFKFNSNQVNEKLVNENNIDREELPLNKNDKNNSILDIFDFWDN
jgi:outer membrane protein assembly factor BamB